MSLAIVPIFRLQGLYNELLASSLIVRIVFRVSSPLNISGNKVFQVSQGWTFDHMGAVSVILGSMEGVSWHGFCDKKIGSPFIFRDHIFSDEVHGWDARLGARIRKVRKRTSKMHVWVHEWGKYAKRTWKMHVLGSPLRCTRLDLENYYVIEPPS